MSVVGLGAQAGVPEAAAGEACCLLHVAKTVCRWLSVSMLASVFPQTFQSFVICPCELVCCIGIFQFVAGLWVLIGLHRQNACISIHKVVHSIQQAHGCCSLACFVQLVCSAHFGCSCGAINHNVQTKQCHGALVATHVCSK